MLRKGKQTNLISQTHGNIQHIQMFRWTNTQAKWHACVGYRIYITPSLGNSPGKKCTATKYLTPVKLCKSLCPILWHRATVSLSLLLIASGSRVARHTRQGAKVLEEDVVLYYLLCLVSSVLHLMLGMALWSKGLLKQRITV